MSVDKKALARVDKALPDVVPEVLERAVRRVAQDMTDMSEAMTHAFDDEKELAALPPKVRRIAKESLKPKSEVAFALMAAAEFVRTHASLINRAKDISGLNIHLHAHKHEGVAMPPMDAPDEDGVIVLDPEKKNV